MAKGDSLITARVDADAKRRGTAALQAAGYTPSQAVQVVWQYAASCADRPDELERTLGALDRRVSGEGAAERKAEASRRIVRSLSQLREKLGTEDVALPELSWRELRDLGLEDRLGGAC